MPLVINCGIRLTKLNHALRPQPSAYLPTSSRANHQLCISHMDCKLSRALHLAEFKGQCSARKADMPGVCNCELIVSDPKRSQCMNRPTGKTYRLFCAVQLSGPLAHSCKRTWRVSMYERVLQDHEWPHRLEASLSYQDWRLLLARLATAARGKRTRDSPPGG